MPVGARTRAVLPGGAGRRSASGASRSTTACRASSRWSARPWSAALAACGVTPDRRPQTLSVDEWACLTDALGPLDRVSVALRLDAPAKLNLSLRVVGRRDDGLHELDVRLRPPRARRSAAAPARLQRPARRGRPTPPSLPLGADNLAWRGLVAGLGGEPDLACLSLEKRVPVAAGLGGGSSDAAAALAARPRVEPGARPADRSDELAALARIGADVPFFAAARRRRARGRHRGAGRAARRRRCAHVVLLHPPFGLSTGERLRRAASARSGEPPANDLLAPGPAPASGARGPARRR